MKVKEERENMEEGRNERKEGKEKDKERRKCKATLGEKREGKGNMIEKREAMRGGGNKERRCKIRKCRKRKMGNKGRK